MKKGTKVRLKQSPEVTGVVDQIPEVYEGFISTEGKVFVTYDTPVKRGEHSVVRETLWKRDLVVIPRGE